MKNIFCLVLSALLLLLMPLSTAAAVPESSVQPRWENMSVGRVTLGFSGTRGTASVSVSRVQNVTTEIEGTVTVYEVDGDDWIYVDSMYRSSTRSLSFSLNFDATSGTEYIAVLEVTAYSEYSSESDTLTDTGTCP